MSKQTKMTNMVCSVFLTLIFFLSCLTMTYADDKLPRLPIADGGAKQAVKTGSTPIAYLTDQVSVIKGKIAIVTAKPKLEIDEELLNLCSEDDLIKSGIEFSEAVCTKVFSIMMTKNIPDIFFLRSKPVKPAKIPFDTPNLFTANKSYSTILYGKNAESNACQWDNRDIICKNIKLKESHKLDITLPSESDFTLVLWPCLWFYKFAPNVSDYYQGYFVFGLFNTKTGEMVALGARLNQNINKNAFGEMGNKFDVDANKAKYFDILVNLMATTIAEETTELLMTKAK